ncbi:hypothetical protein EDB89DRAFT_1996029 [Lactarius sanguifluus]|nr:hypothetical protein EDB89DRAFT_1996029 [Lactarius sanguifluus]
MALSKHGRIIPWLLWRPSGGSLPNVVSALTGVSSSSRDRCRVGTGPPVRIGNGYGLYTYLLTSNMLSLSRNSLTSLITITG